MSITLPDRKLGLFCTGPRTESNMHVWNVCVGMWNVCVGMCNVCVWMCNICVGMCNVCVGRRSQSHRLEETWTEASHSRSAGLGPVRPATHQWAGKAQTWMRWFRVSVATCGCVRYEPQVTQQLVSTTGISCGGWRGKARMMVMVILVASNNFSQVLF